MNENSRLSPWLMGCLILVVGVGVWLLRHPSTMQSESFRRNRDLVSAKDLVKAVEHFHEEYSRMPALSGDWLVTSGEDGSAFLRVVSGKEPEGESMKNPRSLVFFQCVEAKGGRGGILYDGDGRIAGLVDRWGRPFHVVLKGMEDAGLSFKMGDREVVLHGPMAAVWSPGADGVDGTKDDVKSW